MQNVFTLRDENSMCILRGEPAKHQQQQVHKSLYNNHTLHLLLMILFHLPSDIFLLQSNHEGIFRASSSCHIYCNLFRKNPYQAMHQISLNDSDLTDHLADRNIWGALCINQNQESAWYLFSLFFLWNEMSIQV